MKRTIHNNGKVVEIELTPDQIELVKRQSISYTDIQTLEDALHYVGETIESFDQRTSFDDDVQKAYKELEVICQAIRQGNELKDNLYYPWFNSVSSSRGFSYLDYGYGSAGAFVSSRLCVEVPEKATYIGQQFIDIYNRYINGAILSNAQPLPIKKKAFRVYTEIKTFYDACDALGVSYHSFHSEHNSLPAHVYAYMQLRIIARALNGGDNMDYLEHVEYKHYPYFYSVDSSSGFSHIFGGTTTGIGARLTYKTAEIAEYAGKQFLRIYNKYIT